MRNAQRLGCFLVGAMFVLAIGAHVPIEAQFNGDPFKPDGGLGSMGIGLGGGFGRTEEPEGPEIPAPRVHVALPWTERSAEIHRALERPISMPFQNDTPLGDLLDYVRQATSKGDDAIEGGISIYVDEMGLQEAEQSLQSPIKINLEGLPLRTTLRLALDQLDLVYEVQPEGFVIITSKSTQERAVDPMLLILDELRALRAEVEELKRARGPFVTGGMGGGSPGH